MEETHVDAEDDAVPANEDVAVAIGGDSDSTQSQTRSTPQDSKLARSDPGMSKTHLCFSGESNCTC